MNIGQLFHTFLNKGELEDSQENWTARIQHSEEHPRSHIHRGVGVVSGRQLIVCI